MSETDSFIEEVTEEVRRDKLFGYLKKYGWIAVVVVVGAVGTTAFLEWQKAQKSAAAQNLGDLFLAATGQPDAAARAKTLEAVGAEAGDAQVLVELRRAAELAASGDKAAALAVLDQVVADAPNALYRDLATLKALMLRGKDMDQAVRTQALAGLAQPGQAFRPLAMEQQAIMAMETGDNDKALAVLTDVFLDSQATSALRGRAQQMIVALGGEVPASPELQLGQ
ncbi:MAG: tetratricopeptide repeat protein [Rhodobacteraceae bacterium]|nr:tetratricopeptide repeat protein [Paracoccaceae bacterium]